MSGSNTNKELKCNKGPGSWNSYESQVEKQLSEVEDKGKLANDILHVSCCISGAYTENMRSSGGCDLLYYVVGSLAYGKIKENDSFDNIMKEVLKILGDALNNEQCKEVSSAKVEELFKLMEKWSYYKLDPKNIWKVETGDSEKVNCGGCANYLMELAEALREVETYCKDDRNKSMCTGVELEKTHQGSPGYLLGLIYDIIPEFGATLEAEMSQEKKQCLKDLPSDMEHRTFNDIKNECTGSDEYSAKEMKEMLRKILDQYRSPWNSANQIIRGACYAHGTEAVTEPEGNRCKSLYYYIGSVISTVPASVKEFATLMREIYAKLEDINVGIHNQCTNLYQGDNIDKDTFDNMKLIYDYTRDYETIKKYVKNPAGAGFSCAKHYSSYLEKVLSAYEYVSIRCPGRNGKKWCNDLKSTLAQHNKEELLQLKSSLEHISSLSTTDSTTAVTTGSAVGGTLFTLGLPLAAFLSYKYDLLPSGIRKFFLRGGSGTRMRRTAFGPNSDAEMENFTEYYTENGSTTTDPTEYSTLAGSSSNLTTTSTEDSSILYDEDGPSRSPPPSRKKRGGGNNRRGQNISYHSMER